MNKIDLKVVEWFKVGVAALIPAYYCKMMTYSAGVWQMPLVLLLVVIIASYFFRSKREKADDCATKSMLKANSICYKLALVYMALVILPSTLVYGANPANVGYYVIFGFWGLMFCRACLFCWFDKIGVDK